ncbi:MAG: hypothetical protein ACFFAN_09820 [Promethearchaeota archaeon]
MKISEDVINRIQEHLGYNTEEIQEFLKNPRNEDVLSKALLLSTKTIVVEVVKSHGCNSQLKVGDKIYFDAAGHLLTKLSPKKVCIFALTEIARFVTTINELIFAGVDPNDMRFKRLGCSDVGLECGGWGHIVMEVKVEDRRKLNIK